MKYTVTPGLYTIGNPTESSPVLVTANYRLSTDCLHKAMGTGDVWVLVLDTRGINVWCAAGKGTFGTAELINRIDQTALGTVVRHRTLILPQLGAPGVAAHEVRKATGFTVEYGPIRAKDIPAYIKACNRATEAMRTVTFTIRERAILTPMEFFPALRKYLWVILGCAIIMGAQPGGILFRPAIIHSLPILAIGLCAVFMGAVVVPVLLPFIPFRSFALKGGIFGAVALAPPMFHPALFFQGNRILGTAVLLFFIAVTSYVALNFTGCTPFTNISGVKKEMRFAVPVYLTACAAATILIIVYKLQEWGVL